MRIWRKGQLLSRQLTAVELLLANIAVVRIKQTPKVLDMFSTCRRSTIGKIDRHDLTRKAV